MLSKAGEAGGLNDSNAGDHPISAPQGRGDQESRDSASKKSGLTTLCVNDSFAHYMVSCLSKVSNRTNEIIENVHMADCRYSPSRASNDFQVCGTCCCGRFTQLVVQDIGHWG